MLDYPCRYQRFSLNTEATLRGKNSGGLEAIMPQFHKKSLQLLAKHTLQTQQNNRSSIIVCKELFEPSKERTIQHK